VIDAQAKAKPADAAPPRVFLHIEATATKEVRVRFMRCILDHLPVALPQPQQHDLDTLAGSQPVDGEVRAGAGVPKQPRSTDSDAVDFPAARFGFVVAASVACRPLQDSRHRGAIPCLPFANLLFN
jgi:hypothetical protein